MKKMLTGLQPTGVITLGNYIGAIKQMVKYQNEYDSYIFIADLHSLTVAQDPEELRKNIRSLVAIYLACGIDPKKNTIFIQSENEYHTNISWLLECNAYFGELSRMTQFKDKSSKNVNFSVGLFTYPVLMASDILAYDADYVPVGIDQKQHVEIARDIAIRFNKKYGDTFRVPDVMISDSGTKIMDLVDPLKKMSKSSENQKFINLFKANDYKSEEFITFIKNEKNKKYKAFLILTYYIYHTYQKELESRKEIDFSDMISLSTKHVEKHGYKNKIKYIIIDEFQDTSKVRFNLIKAILNKTNANLLVVGDDFQSIYRFTGCDLKLFLDFNKIYKDSKILKIENTYRNSQELINIAGSFIMKNKNQLTKDLKSKKHTNYPIQIIYYKNITKTFIKLIEHIYKTTNKPILILGRNNFDINELKSNLLRLENNNLIYTKNKDIKMTYLTIHRSKGLEEENVIIINLKNNRLGFPNQINDHKILKHVACKKDDYPYAEERRLFYVAITRTKNTTYLLTPIKNESIFTTELKKDYKKQIKIVRKNKF